MKMIQNWTPARIEQLHGLYRNEWWSRERTLDETLRCIQGSQLCFGFADDGDQLQAFCRVVTDYVFKAFIFDVIVSPDCRGAGWGERLIDAVKTHPDIHGVQHFELYCLPELRDYYRRFGFSEDVSGMGLMRHTNPHHRAV